MKAILFPAIALMNRLSFGMKFSLVSAMFVIPMAITNFYLVYSSYEEFMSTRTSLKSLDNVRSAVDVRRSFVELNNLYFMDMYLVRNPGDMSTRIAEKLQFVEAGIKSMTPIASDPEAQAAFIAKRDEIFEGLTENAKESSTTSKAHKSDLLLSNYMGLMKLLASQSGISQDQDPGINQISEFLLGVGHISTYQISQARALGGRAFRVGDQLGSEDGVALDEILGVIEKQGESYKVALNEVMANNSGINTEFSELAEASIGIFERVFRIIEDDILFAGSLKRPWIEYYDKISAELNKTFMVTDGLIDHIEIKMEERLTAKRFQMIALVLALFLIFLVIFYLYAGFYVSTRETIAGLSKVVDQVAAGDMTVHYQASSRDELGDLGGVFNSMVIKVHDLIKLVGDTVVEVESQSDRVKSVSAESNQLVAGQREQIEMVAQAMAEMSQATQEVSSSSATAVQSANSVNDETVNGRALVEHQVKSIKGLAEEIDQSVQVINQLASDSSAISQVLEVIKGIAEQTNLLALNAAIEAARAGEQGRGFAVVADEVRTLAQRTQQSTEEIEQMIVKLQGGVDKAVKAMNASHEKADSTVGQSDKVQEALENIMGAVGMIVDQSQQIAHSAERQTHVAQNIDSNIVEINRAGERTTEGASETEQASRQLSESVVRLKDLISAFQV